MKVKANAKSMDVARREVTIRVRPSVRHVITRNEETFYSDGGSGSSGGTLCEVTSEEAANEIQRALELMYAPRRYVVVQRSFSINNNIVYYAYSEAQASQFKDVLQQFYQTDFRVYEEVLTDPRDVARHIADGAEPMEYLMVHNGELVLTCGKPVQAGGSVTVEGLMVTRQGNGRSVISMELPDHLTPKEAAEYVNNALRRYTDACVTGKLNAA